MSKSQVGTSGMTGQPSRRYSFKRIWTCMVGLSATLALTSCAQPQASENPDQLSLEEKQALNANASVVAEMSNSFAFDLYEQLRSGQDGNLFFSPGSLSTALAMTYAGAQGETAEQMAQVLHFAMPQEELHPAYAALQRTWNVDDPKESGFRLSVANRLWGQRDYDFRQEFLKITRENYDAELAQVDFVRQAELTRLEINAWVEAQTQDKIKDLIPPGVLNDLTRLVLTNAIHFKGDWTEPFSKSATQEAPFHVSRSEKVDVPLMFRQDDFQFWEGEDLKMLELPYGKGELSMLILLPNDIEGLPALEARFNAENLSRWKAEMRTKEVRVHLPRFELTSEFQLADNLSAMGMPMAFSPGKADFSGMSTEEELYISAVIHKAFVDVNEEGTEAAAATGIAVAATAFIEPEEPKVFRADHPFVFLIQDNRTSAILFLGRLLKP